MNNLRIGYIPKREAKKSIFQKPLKMTREEAMQAANNRVIYQNAAQIAKTARERGWIR